MTTLNHLQARVFEFIYEAATNGSPPSPYEIEIGCELSKQFAVRIIGELENLRVVDRKRTDHGTTVISPLRELYFAD